MITIHTGKGRNKTAHNITNLTRDQVNTMTELTQMQMFGEVIRKHYDHSIHPNGRGKAKLNTKRVSVKLKNGKEVSAFAGTEPARTRPDKEYPGGRTLRRAYNRLGIRQNNHQYGTRPGTMKEG